MSTTSGGQDMMLFMTSRSGGPQRKAMLAHQDMFGAFVSARAKQAGIELSLWDNWALDNGAFAGFDQDTFMTKLRRFMPYRANCCFVVVPDVPYQWQPTLARFKDWAPSLRRMGFKIALAVQDGATVEQVPWRDLDALFIGGSTEWKRQLPRRTDASDNLPLFTGVPEQYEQLSTVAELVNEAKVRDKWVHIGRSANSSRQLWYAYRLGADSVDGTHERYAPNVNFPWIAQTMWDIHQHKHKLSSV
jgi:hypothetical protein